MSTVNRRDFLKTSVGILVAGGAATTLISQASASVEKVVKNDGVVELWHGTGTIEKVINGIRLPDGSCPQTSTIHFKNVSGPHPIWKDQRFKIHDRIIFGCSAFAEAVKVGDEVRVGLLEDKAISGWPYRYKGEILNKGIPGIVEVWNLSVVGEDQPIFARYETHQHTINDFARDALARYPKAQWIDLKWPGHELASLRWKKLKDGPWLCQYCDIVRDDKGGLDRINRTGWHSATFLNTA